ncbi:MAG: protein phosphatase 2C domain-containing protein, partial [Akkermansia sp.]|nr:protein phosphatase 2C domain-containing protein [Akkermansia sp.]
MPSIITAFESFTISAASAQWQGSRDKQEDAVAICHSSTTTNKQSFLATLADGVGGLEDGEKASRLLVTTYENLYKENNVIDLQRFLIQANEQLHRAKADGIIGMEAGSTLVALSISDKGMCWQHVGDSLLYRRRAKQLQKLNTPHNIGTDIDRKLQHHEISWEEAAAHEDEREILTSFVCGTNIQEEFKTDTPQVGDRYIIASDGLQPLIENNWENLLDTLENTPADQTCDILIQEIKSINSPNQDNLSIIIIDIMSSPTTDNSPSDQSTHSADSDLRLKESPFFKLAEISKQGDRDSQQDYLKSWHSEKATLLVVADGAGGHIGGAEASRTAVESLERYWNEFLKDGLEADKCDELLKEAILQAHEAVIARFGGNAALSGKAAIVLLYLHNYRYTMVNVGDCRAYISDNNAWKQLSTDDSLLRLLILSGLVKPEDAEGHPDQNTLTQALGSQSRLKPHVESGIYTPASSFLLCCDGLWNQLPKPLMALPAWDTTDMGKTLANMAEESIKAADGRSDNVSAIWAIPTAQDKEVAPILDAPQLTETALPATVTQDGCNTENKLPCSLPLPLLIAGAVGLCAIAATAIVSLTGNDKTDTQ